MAINVFIVDDSAVMRQIFGEILNIHKDFKLAGSAPDPILAMRKMQHQWPDVILLDIEMPKMDGITFLRQIMETRPTPVVICSSFTADNSHLTMEAMSCGAIDVISKPSSDLNGFLASTAVNIIIDSLRGAAKAKVRQLSFLTNKPIHRKQHTTDSILGKRTPFVGNTEQKLIVIGASTGGTDAIYQFIKGMPITSPPILVVQHMPEKFTSAFAARLNEQLPHTIVEAQQGEMCRSGFVYIAPGHCHLLVERFDNHYSIELRDGPLVNRHKPSVDVLFRSVAQNVGANAIGIILTGMGNDGAKGLLEMKQAGASTLAQSEESCVVYGMPKEAIAIGAVGKVASLSTLPYQAQKLLL